MKKIASIGMCLALAGAVAGNHLAHASPGSDPREAYARGATSAEPGATPAAAPPPAAPIATAKAAGGPRPWAPAFDVAFPEGPSAAPTRAEWEAAPPAPEVRVTDPNCAAQRVREWYRVGCRAGHWIEMVSGGREGVSFACRKTSADDEVCDASWVVFPARRGDRRAFDVFTWGKWSPSPDTLVTEQFLEGDPSPSVAVHGLHWGF